MLNCIRIAMVQSSHELYAAMCDSDSLCQQKHDIALFKIMILLALMTMNADA
jgi:hypothetical protein